MFNKFMYIYITVSILVCILFVPVLYCYNFNSIDAPGYSESFDIISSKFVWPIPGYTYISSYFGKRTSPTAGASSYHSGLDIPAPEGTYLFAVDDGYISFASWGAGGGYTIVLNSTNFPDFSFSYCHVSPTMFVSVGDTVNQKQCIGMVGPKNVYGINNNPYKDSNGNPTNGATTGCHLHFSVKSSGNVVNPLDFYTIK